jgi:hypothetical protein
MEKQLKITDQLGRVVAILVVAPMLFCMGSYLLKCKARTKEIGYILITFSVIFFIYELFWIKKASKHACL